MIDDITIPPEALKMAARAVYEAWCTVHGVAGTSLPWEDVDDEERDACFAEARAACLAMLRAWPGIIVKPATPDGQWTHNATTLAHIILPLPKEGA